MAQEDATQVDANGHVNGAENEMDVSKAQAVSKYTNNGVILPPPEIKGEGYAQPLNRSLTALPPQPSLISLRSLSHVLPTHRSLRTSCERVNVTTQNSLSSTQSIHIMLTIGIAWTGSSPESWTMMSLQGGLQQSRNRRKWRWTQRTRKLCWNHLRLNTFSTCHP